MTIARCGDAAKSDVPKKPFFADTLDRNLATKNRAICTRAGVKEGPLLAGGYEEPADIPQMTLALIFVDLPINVMYSITKCVNVFVHQPCVVCQSQWDNPRMPRHLSVKA